MPRCPPSPGSKGRADRPARQPKGARDAAVRAGLAGAGPPSGVQPPLTAPQEPPTPPGSRGRVDRPAEHSGACTMTEAAVSLAGNLTDDPEVRSTEGGIARA